MAKHKRSGQRPPHSTSQVPPSTVAPGSTAGTSRSKRTPSPAPAPARLDRRVALVVGAVLIGVVVLGGAWVFSGGLGPSGATAVATPAPPALAAAPARDIAPVEAAARWEAGALLLDVREDAEWAAGHVPGATHIPLGQLGARVSELPDDQTILVICRSGNRSQEGRDILFANGLAPVTSVEGGVRAWRDAGLPYEGEII